MLISFVILYDAAVDAVLIAADGTAILTPFHMWADTDDAAHRLRRIHQTALGQADAGRIGACQEEEILLSGQRPVAIARAVTVADAEGGGLHVFLKRALDSVHGFLHGQ